jgi:threonine synthase
MPEEQQKGGKRPFNAARPRIGQATTASSQRQSRRTDVTTPINESDIARVRELIDPIFLDSPLVRQETIDDRLDCKVALKIETLNPIRSFKGRGTEALMASLKSKPSHVVTTSSGNFGQGVARAATKRGIRSTSDFRSGVKVPTTRSRSAAPSPSPNC